jgi:hypothetical protein
MSWHHAVKRQRAVLAVDDVGLLTLDIRQIARDSFEQVGLRHNALEASVLVKDSCETHWRLFEPLQHFEDRRRLRNDQWLSDDRQRVEWLAVERLIEKLLFHAMAPGRRVVVHGGTRG